MGQEFLTTPDREGLAIATHIAVVSGLEVHCFVRHHARGPLPLLLLLERDSRHLRSFLCLVIRSA